LQSFETLVTDGKVSMQTFYFEWKAMLREMWVFLIGTAGFITFVVWNGGVAVGDTREHPFPAFYLGNPYFFLFLFFLLFLPLHVPAFRRLWSALNPKRTVLLLLGVVGFFLLYWMTFQNTHDYNQARYDWWLHNRVLLFAVANPVHKALFFVPVVGGLLSLSCIPLAQGAYALVYAFTFLSLSPSWLIEQRYALIPLTMIMLMRKQEHWLTENLLLLYWLLLNVALLLGINRREFFL
jgi:alpha-1,2-glucosyltransferase